MKFKFKPHPYGMFVIYFLMMLIGLLLGICLFALIGSYRYGITFSEMIDISQMTTETIKDASSQTKQAYYFLNAYLNFFEYLLMAIALFIYSKSFLIEDIFIIKKERKHFFFMLGMATLSVLGMFATSFVANYLVTKLSQGNQVTSTNQNIIVLMIKEGFGPIVFITVFLLAPFVEELIYRKAVFKFLARLKPVWQILISGAIFAAPHMLSQESSLLIWTILFVSYMTSGVLLGVVYYFSKRNIYTTFYAHSLNNLISFLLVI